MCSSSSLRPSPQKAVYNIRRSPRTLIFLEDDKDASDSDDDAMDPSQCDSKDPRALDRRELMKIAKLPEDIYLLIIEIMEMGAISIQSIFPYHVTSKSLAATL